MARKLSNGALVPAEPPTTTRLSGSTSALRSSGLATSTAPSTASLVKEARLLRVAAQSVLPGAVAVRDAPGPVDGVLASDYSVLMEKAVDMGVDLLKFIGPASPRYVELFGSDGSSLPPPALLASFRLVVRGDIEAACLRDFVVSPAASSSGAFL